MHFFDFMFVWRWVMQRWKWMLSSSFVELTLIIICESINILKLTVEKFNRRLSLILDCQWTSMIIYSVYWFRLTYYQTNYIHQMSDDVKSFKTAVNDSTSVTQLCHELKGSLHSCPKIRKSNIWALTSHFSYRGIKQATHKKLKLAKFRTL